MTIFNGHQNEHARQPERQCVAGVELAPMVGGVDQWETIRNLRCVVSDLQAQSRDREAELSGKAGELEAENARLRQTFSEYQELVVLQRADIATVVAREAALRKAVAGLADEMNEVAYVSRSRSLTATGPAHVLAFRVTRTQALRWRRKLLAILAGEREEAK